MGGGSARRRKMPTVVRLGSPPVKINRGHQGRGVAPYDRWSLAAGQLENGWKWVVSLPDEAMSPRAIVATTCTYRSQKISHQVRKLFGLTDDGVWPVAGQKMSRNDRKLCRVSARRRWQLRLQRTSMSVGQTKDLGEGSCRGSRLYRWTLAGAGKCPKRVAATMEIDYKNSVAIGYCSGANGNGGYRLISTREVVSVVPNGWLEVGQGLAGGELKWPRCYG